MFAAVLLSLVAAVAEADASEPLPVIDFPLLDRVRSVDLIDLDFEFPEALKELDGKRVELVGFMAPFDSLDDMRRCMIVPSYVGCTFCSPPSLTQVVFVTQGSKKTSKRYPFIEPPSRVVGTLRLSVSESERDGQSQGFMYSIENAVVTPYAGEGPSRAPGHGAAPHQSTAPPVAMSGLVSDVAEIVGRDPSSAITIEKVPFEAFERLIRTRLGDTFPEGTREARRRAFSLMGFLPRDADWIGTLTELELSRRVAFADDTGERVYLLDLVADDHPYVRLELVGEIAVAITRQHDARRPGVADAKRGVESDDVRRSREAILHGIRLMASDRYARSRGITTNPRPPAGIVLRAQQRGGEPPSAAFRLWQGLPAFAGAFFVDVSVGATGPFSVLDPVFEKPPSTSMELFRPRWYEQGDRWEPDPVPSDFATGVLAEPPLFTDVLGIGGLIPWLAQWYPFDAAKALAGGWTGDRWVVWDLAEGGPALLLEVRWRDEESAKAFRDAIPVDAGWRIQPHVAGSTSVVLMQAEVSETFESMNWPAP